MNTINNPTNEITLDFAAYCADRAGSIPKTDGNGESDYSFRLDGQLRKRLDGVPGLYRFARAYTSGIVPYQKREAMSRCTLVTSASFPKLYRMSEKCARTLGIGLPTMFVEPNVQLINAWTFAFSDSAPIIVLTSALVERFTDEQLLFVIGHECGHIHNRHGIYSSIVHLIINGGILGATLGGVAASVMQLLSASARLAILAWNRAAEITCDRAGMLCTGELDSALSSFASFLSGGMMNGVELPSSEEALLQLNAVKETPVRLLELMTDHPIPARRMLAAKAFFMSEPFIKQYPSLKGDGKTLSKQELDDKCESYVRLSKDEK